MIVESDIGSVRIMIGSDDATDICHVWHTRKLVNLAPVLAAIFGDLNQAIISADVNQSFFLLRFGQR